ncbi:MAG: lactate racemase domain-containing protein [Acidimicrobiales bacterium]
MPTEVLGEARLLNLGSGAWHGDRSLAVLLPSQWSVKVHWPATPPEITDDEIRRCLDQPVGQPPLRRLVTGCTRPVVVVDDLTRPTPLERLMPFVLAEFEAAGIPPEQVTLVMATGTHGPPGSSRAMERKAGQLAATRCRVLVHDHLGDVVRLGRTSYGTPVLVNRDVAESDYVVGIGGVYPQHTTWFGGGTKLVLGVLGERSIAHLHYRHWGLLGSYALENDFRRDLGEVAAMAGLRTSMSVHIDAYRRPVRVSAGDPESFYPGAARYSRETYSVPTPGDADVVIANAYPMDLSLTFATSKGTVPLKHAKPGASRVLLAACPEGDGHHGLFPLLRVPPNYYRIQRLRRHLVARRQLASRVAWRLTQAAAGRIRAGRAGPTAAEAGPTRPIHLYRPAADGAPPIDARGAGVVATSTWEEILARVSAEQGDGPLRAVVYPCAPLQRLAFDG